jgi:hypothetical protein
LIKTVLLASLILVTLVVANSSQVVEAAAPTGKAINSKYVTILKHSFRFDQTNYPYHILGVLANTNKNLNITQIFIYGQLFDKEGNLITADSSSPDFSTLRPGENSTFHLSFLALANESIDHYVIFPSGAPS